MVHRYKPLKLTYIKLSMLYRLRLRLTEISAIGFMILKLSAGPSKNNSGRRTMKPQTLRTTTRDRIALSVT